ncbi:prolyl hydroxylase family protein [Alteriqipengyuania lutimaris]|uniref:2OG-Fe(II) oxygenase n=1 Tax=Alteriqipengyuania lutimaris TaxID=1538146 RepID=A0A395LNJ3_9SPHN|nr:2OG-Fe(II) oxygenase [Alteriqipengyuania lutimaris]MBB3033160.1 prolyl 4-hydroxylase [Alteriqipengyuania lutimaris]RDS78633.1 2OG-Fe(II) oxygenase [Alteriqipengyuania lutimaris]
MAETKTKVPDQDGLARVGKIVRQRLEADPKAYKVPSDKAEIYAIGEFLTSNECRQLAGKIDQVARPSSLYEGTYKDGFRTSYSGNFDRDDPMVKMISRRIDDALGLPGKLGETMQGQRYLPGQQFKDHHDYFYPSEDYWKQEKKNGGQRSWTAMMFLNNVPAGGATAFPELGIRIEPKAGVLLAWNNAKPDGTPNEYTLHAGTPVTEGVKYVITRWYRSRKWG